MKLQAPYRALDLIARRRAHCWRSLQRFRRPSPAEAPAQVADSWPIAAATFILMPKKVPKLDDSAQALKFFTWAYAKGGTMAEELDYVPMPPKVVDAIHKSWQEIKDAGGKPVFAVR